MEWQTPLNSDLCQIVPYLEIRFICHILPHFKEMKTIVITDVNTYVHMYIHTGPRATRGVILEKRKLLSLHFLPL
jgi:hypothetical protein